MEFAKRSSVSTAFSRILKTFSLTRNANFIMFIAAGAVVFELSTETVTSSIWERLNKGKSFEDVMKRLKSQQE